LTATASVTTGTLANPLFDDDNGGRQFAGRVAVRPTIGLVLGASAARGPFVSSDAARAATGENERYSQTAWGADAEYSRGYYLIRFEALASRFALPALGTPAIQQPLRSSGASLEGRYKVAPGLYFAARVDRLAFSEISGSSGFDNWDAPVTRVEVGGGYSLQRNLLLKVSYQRNARDTAFRSRAHLTAAEVMFWF
jgi:predicted porin